MKRLVFNNRKKFVLLIKNKINRIIDSVVNTEKIFKLQYQQAYK